MNAKDSKFAVCRHVKTNGRRCQSPSLTGAALCYFHRNLHHTHRRPPTAETLLSTWQEETIQAFRSGGEDPLTIARAYPRQNEIKFPPLEDAESVQLATSMLFQAIATGQIHFQRARLLLYTLKIASINQRALANARAADHSAEDRASSAIPSHIVRTTHGHTLAAPDDASASLTPPPTPSPTDPPVAPDGPTETLRPVSSEDLAALNHTGSDNIRPEAAAEQNVLLKGTASQAAEKLASEIGRDFSPGISGTESMRALAPGTRFSPLSARNPTFSAACSAVPITARKSQGFSPWGTLSDAESTASEPQTAPLTLIQ